MYLYVRVSENIYVCLFRFLCLLVNVHLCVSIFNLIYKNTKGGAAAFFGSISDSVRHKSVDGRSAVIGMINHSQPKTDR